MTPQLSTYRAADDGLLEGTFKCELTKLAAAATRLGAQVRIMATMPARA